MPRSRQRRRAAAARFARSSHQQYIERILADEEAKNKHAEFLDHRKRQSVDVLSRTIEVYNVKDLKQAVNLRALQLFIESRSGPVEFCVTIKPTKRNRSGGRFFPPARIRFRLARDAQRLFGGTSLDKVKGSVPLPCSLGCKQGCITVAPSKPYSNMLSDDETLRGEIIPIEATSLALGHWCPRDRDMFFSNSDTKQDARDESELWVEEVRLRQPVNLRIDLSQRTIEIQAKWNHQTTSDQTMDNFISIFRLASMFDNPGKPTTSTLSFRFKDMWHNMEVCCEQGEEESKSLLVVLKYPPKLENHVPDWDSLGFTVNDTIERSLDYPGIDASFFGRCRAFKLTLDRESLIQLAKHEAFPKLYDFGLLRSSFRSSRYNTLTDFSDARSIRSLVLTNEQRQSGIERLGQLMNEVHDMDDQTVFILRAAVDQNSFAWYHLLHDIGDDGATLPLTILRIRFRGQSKVLQVLKRICDIEGGCTSYPLKLFNAMMAEPGMYAGYSGNNLPDHCLQIPRLLLTPCQGRALGFETEMSNRALRLFVEEQGFSPTSFLRVSLGHENGQKLFGADLSPVVEARFTNTILSGLSINGYAYHFLAYSSSQLKECSLWMVRLEGSWTVERMRRRLGDFSKCKSASKYAARIGQCFSTTYVSQSSKGGNGQGVKKWRHAKVPDIEGKGQFSNKMHTDGTGMIARRVFDEILGPVPFAPQDTRDASIIQVRYGGAKGTLTAWHDSVLRQKFPRTSVDVLLRDSMLKFDAPLERIEICAVGSSIPYYLNRNVILILSSLGIPDTTFLRIQQAMLDDLDGMLTTANNACDMLPRLSGPDTTIRSILNDMLDSGVAPQDDPFLFSCLHAIRSNHLFQLRKKSRIFIADGAVLMGGIDETGLLPEGCVYVHSSRYKPKGKGSDDICIVQGPVMVTKHPVMYVGDVRMLRAVSVPALESHRNVILFSKHGQRPEPDKMAGSDLDGDEFAVTWDSRLFLDTNQEPLDYADAAGQPPPPFPSAADAQDQALVNHFINHIKNDNLGRIAMLWQDHASKAGASCESCHELAQLHSIAVDFPKSGIPAVLPDHLLLKPDEERAHWRELKQYPVFHCRGVVGQLYDDVISRNQVDARLKRLKAFAGRDMDRYGQILASSARLDQLGQVYDRTIPQRLGLVDEYDEILEVASHHREWYDEAISGLMHKYKVPSEGELITGCIRKFHKLHRRREHEIAQEIRRSIRQLRTEYRELFFATVLKLVDSPDQRLEEEAEDDEIPEEVLASIKDAATRSSSTCSRFQPREMSLRLEAFRLAAAYYITSYEPNQWEASNGKVSVLFSFPWVVASDVIKAGLDDAVRRADAP